MNRIPFPLNYHKALLNKTKNTSIRIGEELGRYKKGKIYKVESYDGKDWGIKIKITEVFHTKLNKLTAFGIPERSINAILRREKISTDDRVDLIRFKIL